ncbi:MAG: YqgE/AlgH family protein, partial [Acidimicrobiales bacterium]
MEEAKVPFIGMSLAGRILVARPDLEDPRFNATLMLLLEHGSEGALGVVINRPSKLELADAFPDWED